PRMRKTPSTSAPLFRGESAMNPSRLKDTSLKGHLHPTPLRQPSAAERGCPGWGHPREVADVPTAGSCQLVEEVPCFFEVGGIEPSRKPTIDRCEQLPRLYTPAQFGPQPGEASCRAQLIGLCMLTPRDTQRLLERSLSLFEPAEAKQGETFEAVKFR